MSSALFSRLKGLPTSRLWSAGCAGQARAVQRQIRLLNQLAMLGIGITIFYQGFFLLLGAAELLGVVLLNLLFMLGYAAVIRLNAAQRHNVARHLGTGIVLTHILIIAYIMSAAIGAHLFYIPLAGLLVLLYPRDDWRDLLILFALPLLLCLVSQFFFLNGLELTNLTEPVENLLYAMSVGLCVMTSSLIAHLYRRETEQAEQEQTAVRKELERLSGIDQLTQIANRRRLDQYLEKEWLRMQRAGKPLAVLMVDIDLFKKYNDHFGHLEGDECLRIVARILTSVAQRPADLVARFGGEEFVLVLPETDADGALLMAEQVRKAIQMAAIPHATMEVASSLTVSVGAASMIPVPGCKSDVLIKLADQGLYQAKHSGRNTVKLQHPPALANCG